MSPRHRAGPALFTELPVACGSPSPSPLPARLRACPFAPHGSAPRPSVYLQISSPPSEGRGLKSGGGEVGCVPSSVPLFHAEGLVQAPCSSQWISEPVCKFLQSCWLGLNLVVLELETSLGRAGAVTP